MLISFSKNNFQPKNRHIRQLLHKSLFSIMKIDQKPKTEGSSVISEILPGMRVIYTKGELLEEDCPQEPINLFEKWMLDACENKNICEPNAMTLATCTKDGFPSARIVLLKGFRKEGFIFYTNYNSRKSVEMMENPRAALVFGWIELERSVRVEGIVEKVTQEESEEYFKVRPRGAQVGAWASLQSSVAKDRKEIEEQFKVNSSLFGKFQYIF